MRAIVVSVSTPCNDFLTLNFFIMKTFLNLCNMHTRNKPILSSAFGFVFLIFLLLSVFASCSRNDEVIDSESYSQATERLWPRIVFEFHSRGLFGGSNCDGGDCGTCPGICFKVYFLEVPQFWFRVWS